MLEHQDHMNIHSLTFSRIDAKDIRAAKMAERRELQRRLGYRTGNFHKRTVKGKKYWYFFDNDTKAQKYIAKEGELDSRLEAYNKSEKTHKDWKAIADVLPT